MPTTSIHEITTGFEEDTVFEISVRATRTELIDLNITPKYLEMEMKNIFSPRRKPVELITDGIAEFFRIEVDISKIFVDHLVMNLENRPILDIVIFLSKYCGWDRIKKQMDEYVEKLERG